MADNTQIEWADATWNPVTGCSVVSPGCKHCYAMKLAHGRLHRHPSRQGLTTGPGNNGVWTGEVRFNEGWLDQPARWKRGRRIFVCAHGDLFHEKVPDAWIDRIFAVMALSPQHTFLVLTKRAARMSNYLTAPELIGRLARAICKRTKGPDWREITAQVFQWDIDPETLQERAEAKYGASVGGDGLRPWPLPHVWLGVSVEDQQRADERIPLLLDTPAAKRFISAEPLLGPIDLGMVKIGLDTWLDVVKPEWPERFPLGRGLDWVIVGGESGKSARPCDPAWVRPLRDQCLAADVAFFFKQWGQYFPAEVIRTGPDGEVWRTQHDGVERWYIDEFSLGLRAGTKPVEYNSVGKKGAGRLLDGREHSEFPV